MSTRFLIYLLTNTISQKHYVGVTRTSLSRRWYIHKYTAANTTHDWKLPRAIRKYGVGCWVKTELCVTLDITHACALEEHFVTEYNSYTNGYNSTKGGDLHNNYTKSPKWTEERKRKMSEKHKGKSYHAGKSGADNPRHGMPGTMLGQAHSPDAKNKMKAAWEIRTAQKASLRAEKSSPVVYEGVLYETTQDAATTLGFGLTSNLRYWMNRDPVTKVLTWKTNKRPKWWAKSQ